MDELSLSLLVNFSLLKKPRIASCLPSFCHFLPRVPFANAQRALIICNTSIPNHKLATNNYIASINPTPGSWLPAQLQEQNRNPASFPTDAPSTTARLAARLLLSLAHESRVSLCVQPSKSSHGGGGEGRTQFPVGKDDS